MFSCSSDKYPEVELVDHMIDLLKKIFKHLHTVFYSGCANTFLPAMHKGMIFSTSLLTLFLVFENSPSSKCEEISHCNFDLYFHDD